MISKIGLLTVQLKGLPRQMEKVPCFDMYFIRVVSLKSRSGQNLLVKCKRGIALFWLNLWLLMTTSQTFPFQTKVCLFPPQKKLQHQLSFLWYKSFWQCETKSIHVGEYQLGNLGELNLATSIFLKLKWTNLACCQKYIIGKNLFVYTSLTAWCHSL